MAVDTLITNCSILTPSGRTPPGMGVAITDGKIAGIGELGCLPEADEEIDVGGNILVPGIIDCHVHERSPGYEYKEDWETATRAAAAGGVTTIMGHPNNDPVIDRPEHLERKYQLGEENALVDFQCFAAVSAENIDQIEPLHEAGTVGYQASLGSNAFTDGELVAILEEIRKTGKRFGLHTENGEIIDYYTEKLKSAGANDPIHHCRARPAFAEEEGISRLVVLANETGCPIHIFQLSTGSGAKQVRRAKEMGLDMTAEALPHNLWFTEDVMNEKGNIARISPPIRSAEQQDGLWEVGMDDGVVDCIATDHAPHTDSEKGVSDPFGSTWEASPGFVGLETEVPALLTFVNEGRLTLERWVHMHSTRPAQIWGMYPEKGSLLVGTDADFTIIDPDHQWVLDRNDLHSKSTATPFDGETFTGAVTSTVVRGSLVYHDGTITGTPGYGERVDVN